MYVCIYIYTYIYSARAAASAASLAAAPVRLSSTDARSDVACEIPKATRGSVPCACVLVSPLYMHRL